MPSNDNENVLNPRDFQWVKNTNYLRVNTCIENVDRLQSLFNDGPCDVVKNAKSTTCGIYVEFPATGIVPDGFNLDEKHQYISRSVGKVKILGKDLRDLIHYESAPGAIRVITVCNDDTGKFEGATTYFIERVGIKGTDDIVSADGGSADTPQDNTGQGTNAQQPQANTATPQDNTGQATNAPQPQASTDTQQTNPAPTESRLHRDVNGKMLPIRLIRKYEAEGDGNSEQPQEVQELESEAIAKAADSFLAGKFAQGLLDLTDENFQAELVGAASIVTNERLPWLGHCTFSIGTGQDVNKKPALRMAVLPWDHSSKSKPEDAWECVRTCASVKDLDKDTVKDVAQASANTKPTSAPTAAGTPQNAGQPNPLLQAAGVSQQPQPATGQPQNQIQAQQQLGHSPSAPTEDQQRAQLTQQETTNPVSYAQSLFSVVSKKFASAAGRDSVNEYKVFCKWRDVMYDTSNPEENGLAKVSAEDMKNKHTNFRGRTNAARWILF